MTTTSIFNEKTGRLHETAFSGEEASILADLREKDWKDVGLCFYGVRGSGIGSEENLRFLAKHASQIGGTPAMFRSDNHGNFLVVEKRYARALGFKNLPDETPGNSASVQHQDLSARIV